MAYNEPYKLYFKDKYDFVIAKRKRHSLIAEVEDPVATILLFPGALQSLTRFLKQVDARPWLAARVRLVALAALMPNYAWSAVITKNGLHDILAVEHLLNARQITGPLVFAGHTTGACFAHVAAFWFACKHQRKDVAVLSNSGYLWQWLKDSLRTKLLPKKYPVLFRSGQFDNRVSKKDWVHSAQYYENLGHPCYTHVVPGVASRWTTTADEKDCLWLLQQLEVAC